LPPPASESNDKPFHHPQQDFFLALALYIRNIISDPCDNEEFARFKLALKDFKKPLYVV